MRIKLRPLFRPSRLLLLTALLLSPLCSTLAVSGDGLVAYPADPDPTTGQPASWFVYQLDRGQTKHDQLTVKNDSDQKQTVKIYAVDSTVNNVGEFALEAESDPKDNVGGWIKLESSSVELEPNQEKQVGFTISIPQDALAGESSGGIVVQKEAAAPDQSQSGFIITTRIGIRVYETVPGEVIRKLSFGDAKLSYDQKKQLYTLDVDLKNESNVSLEPDLKIDIKDTLFGSQNQLLEQKTAIPRQGKVKATFTFKKPKLGKFDIIPTATYQKADGQRETVTSDQKLSFWTLPWDEIIIIGLLLLANLLFLLVLKLLSRREKKFYKSYRVQAGDNLETIARQLGTEWKKLATINHLKPPYQITTGQIITVFDKKDMLEQLYMETERQEGVKSVPLPALKRPTHKLSSRLSASLVLRKNLYLLIALASLLLLLCYVLYAGLLFKQNSLHFEASPTPQESAAPTQPAKQTQPATTADTPQDQNASAGSNSKQRDQVNIQVLNGNGVKGACSQAVSALRAAGYDHVASGNADSFEYEGTTIACSADIDSSLCSEIVSIISASHPGAQASTSDRLSAGSVRIVLGK